MLPQLAHLITATENTKHSDHVCIKGGQEKDRCIFLGGGEMDDEVSICYTTLPSSRRTPPRQNWRAALLSRPLFASLVCPVSFRRFQRAPFPKQRMTSRSMPEKGARRKAMTGAAARCAKDAMARAIDLLEKSPRGQAKLV